MIINLSQISNAIIDLDSAHNKLLDGGMPKTAEYVQGLINDIEDFVKAVKEI